MFERIRRAVGEEIDGRRLARTIAAAIVLIVALTISLYGTRSIYRHDLEVATSVLVIGVLVCGIYFALTAEPPDRH